MGRVLLIDEDDDSEKSQESVSEPNNPRNSYARDENELRGVGNRSDSHTGEGDTRDSNESGDESVIRLDHFLQQCGAAMTGGHAKMLIQAGEVTVDEQIETRRRRKLRVGQVVGVGGQEISVEF